MSRPRFCRKCQAWKPERAHHCSVCKKCILKMDHHCIWVVNCVGARNYKSFMLFLFYTMLATLLVSIALFPVFFEEITLNNGERRRRHTKGAFGNLALSLSLSLLTSSILHDVTSRASSSHESRNSKPIHCTTWCSWIYYNCFGYITDAFAIIILTFILDAAFCISLIGFIWMHLNMIKLSETSIETYDRPQTPGPPGE